MSLLWSPAHWQQLSALLSQHGLILCQTIKPTSAFTPVEGASTFVSSQSASTSVSWGLRHAGKTPHSQSEENFFLEKILEKEILEKEVTTSPKSGALIIPFRVVPHHLDLPTAALWQHIKSKS